MIATFNNGRHAEWIMERQQKIRVAELFAGVGGFRLGLERKGVQRSLRKREKNSNFKVVWSNQYEPKTNKQHASDIYVKNFNLVEDEHRADHYLSDDGTELHVNISINDVDGADVYDHDLLVGGFPCQDYSVMRAISREVRNEAGEVESGEEGIKGPRGELWWEIEKVLRNKKPRLVFLENVSRLLSSPALHKGKNFEIVIRSMVNCGYDVEWRTINASDYGMPQSRNRVFIFGYKRGKNSPISPELASSEEGSIEFNWLRNLSPFTKTFPYSLVQELPYQKSLPKKFGKKESFFKNAGIARLCNDKSTITVVQLIKSVPEFEKKMPLNRIIKKKLTKDELEIYSIPEEEKDRWLYLKGCARKEFRIKDVAKSKIPPKTLKIYENLMKEPKILARQDKWDRHRDLFLNLVKENLAYRYDIGAMRWPDHLHETSRTIVTSEGGRGPSRTRHIIHCDDSVSTFRRLMPLELERLNQFPDNWTKITGISDSRRGFLMGNALVVGVVERLAEPISELFSNWGE